MAKFETLQSRGISLPGNDIDTDQIIPARYLKITDKSGLGEKLFCDWRFAPDGSPKPDHVLNQPGASERKVLIAEHNFGCGSSREHAPWALVAFGFRAIIAHSFADIFKSNSLKNGLLPVEVGPEFHAGLLKAYEQKPDLEISVDLASQTVSIGGGESSSFEVDEFAKHCLLNGVDQLGYLLSFDKEIAAHHGAPAFPMVPTTDLQG